MMAKGIEAGELVWARVGDAPPFPAAVQTTSGTNTTVRLLHKPGDAAPVHTLSNDRITEYSSGLHFAVSAALALRRRLADVLEHAVSSGRFAAQVRILTSDAHAALVAGLRETEVTNLPPASPGAQQDELSAARAHLRRCIATMNAKRNARDGAAQARREAADRLVVSRRRRADARLRVHAATCALEGRRQMVARLGTRLAEARAELAAALLQQRAASALALQTRDGDAVVKAKEEVEMWRVRFHTLQRQLREGDEAGLPA